MTATALEHERSLLVLADRIHTLAGPPATAALIQGGRIVATGSAAELRERAPFAERLDLSGATITPGLTDAHVHLTEWAFARNEVDLAHAGSPAQAAREIAGGTGSGWLRGRGWNAHLWNGTAPDRAVLDDVAPDRPVALQSHDMHALWVNSAALRAAGIGDSTADPEGGRIVRDESGAATGLLLENAAQLVSCIIPNPSVAESARAVLAAQAELHTLGIIGVHSFPGIHRPVPDPFTVLQRIYEDGALRLRVLQHIPVDDLDAALDVGIRSGFGDEWLRIGAVKMFLDGALGSRTAWMREPYEGDGGTGIRTMDSAEFEAIVRRAAAGGIATTVHAIGDGAVCLALDVLCDPGVRVPRMPHRIEHLQCCPIDRLADAANAGVVCSMQPSHMITDWSIADRCWGAERSRGAFAVGTLLRNGTVLAFGSDVPVEPVDPRRGLHAAALRQDLQFQPDGGWFAGERISLLDALRGYTIGPARAAGDQEPAGTLAPGARADLAAWDRDPLGDVSGVLDMRCIAAMVGGEFVHQV